MGGKEHSLGSLVESRGTVLKAEVSLDFRKPLHLPADRQGRPAAPGSHRDSLFGAKAIVAGIELASRAVLDRNRQGQSLGAED